MTQERRITLRMPEDLASRVELDLSVKRSEYPGMSMNDWIVGCVRRSLDVAHHSGVSLVSSQPQPVKTGSVGNGFWDKWSRKSKTPSVP